MIGALLWLACSPADVTPAWPWPPAVPPPVVPPDNAMTPDRVALGRALFADVRLSRDRDASCSTCHDPASGFDDGLMLSVAPSGDVLPRNTQGLANVAWYATITWGNPVLRSLEDQAVVPLVGDLPPELDLGGELNTRLVELAADPSLDWAAAYPDEPVDLYALTRALAAYERSLVSFDAPVDRRALSDQAARGQILFDDVGCATCHPPPLYTLDAAFEGEPTPGDEAWANVGLYADDALPAASQGLGAFTGEPADAGRHRIPGLRDVSLTAPYMHDGSLVSLGDVVRHFASGGVEGATTDPRVEPFELSSDDEAALTAFLEALTTPR